jgi:hypothetical protein
MIDGGALTVSLARSGGGLRIAVDAPPPVSLGRMMEGKTAEEAVRLVSLVFNTCAAAQEGAARAAFGLAQEPDVGQRIAYETLRDHALKLCVAWPLALDQRPDHAALAAVASLRADDGAALGRALFGPSGAPRHIDAFERWIADGETAPARALAHVWRRFDSRWGRASLPLWRPGDGWSEIDWEHAEIDGGPVETGVAARVRDAHLMREIEARRGRGVIWRLAARLADADRILAALARGETAAPRRLAPGVGVAEAARGTLLIRASAHDGCVDSFDRLSPTDCALHHDGVLTQVLDSLPRRPGAPLRQVAALAMESVDPCVPCRLDVIEGGRA